MKPKTAARILSVVHFLRCWQKGMAKAAEYFGLVIWVFPVEAAIGGIGGIVLGGGYLLAMYNGPTPLLEAAWWWACLFWLAVLGPVSLGLLLYVVGGFWFGFGIWLGEVETNLKVEATKEEPLPPEALASDDRAGRLSLYKDKVQQ